MRFSADLIHLRVILAMTPVQYHALKVTLNNKAHDRPWLSCRILRSYRGEGCVQYQGVQHSSLDGHASAHT